MLGTLALPVDTKGQGERNPGYVVLKESQSSEMHRTGAPWPSKPSKTWNKDGEIKMIEWIIWVNVALIVPTLWAAEGKQPSPRGREK